MTAGIWFLLVGTLLFAMGLTAGVIRRLPFTTAIVYLLVGILVGPTVLHGFHFNPLQQSALLEVITEIAVLLSLFTAGMKMPVPVRAIRWRVPLLFAFAGMAITASLMTWFGYYALGLPIGAAVLLAGVLAPTDPVLATEVQVRHPGDRDRLRFGLTCEAGMNDGTAFPVVMLGLGLLGMHELGDQGWHWLAFDVLWATTAGIVVGIAGGVATARLVHWLRHRGEQMNLLSDFLALGLIALVYGISLLLDAWGFLSVFFAAVALRQSELKLGSRPGRSGVTSESHSADARAAPQHGITDDSLVFNEQLERLSEVVLVLLIGGMLFVDSWSWRAVSTALFLFLVARPLAILAVTTGTRLMPHLRALCGWFGVRGIGSMYYLMYAIQHGLPEDLALELLHITLIVVALSILVHGLSVKPMLGRFRQFAPEGT